MDLTEEIFPPPSYSKGSTFLEEGYEALKAPLLKNFFHLFNANRAKYPEEAQELLDALADKFKEKINDPSVSPLNAYSAYRSFESVGDESEIAALGAAITQRLNTEGYPENGAVISGRKRTGTKQDPADYLNLISLVQINFSYKVASIELVRKAKGFGTGVIVDKNHVITNFHVVSHAVDRNTVKSEISLKYRDTWQKGLELVSWDAVADLALLKVQEELPIEDSIQSHFGNSDTLKKGMSIFAIGNHSVLESTITNGIVSGVKRMAPELGDWLQIDATVTGGASGGLAVGEDGLIYGILVAHDVNSENIAFVIPSNTVAPIVEMMLEEKPIIRGWGGVHFKKDPFNEREDIEVDYLFSSSPLSQNGVRKGDRLLSVNGKEVRTLVEAQRLLYNHTAGNVVRFVFENSDKAQKEVWVELIRRPDYPVYALSKEEASLSTLRYHFGFRVNKKIDTIQQIYIDQFQSIVVPFHFVIDIEEDSPLDMMGVKKGDRIGIFFDEFDLEYRRLGLIHWPNGKQFRFVLKNGNHFVHFLGAGKYDENTL